MVQLLRHRQPKGSETDRLHLTHRVTPRLHTMRIKFPISVNQASHRPLEQSTKSERLRELNGSVSRAGQFCIQQLPDSCQHIGMIVPFVRVGICSVASNISKHKTPSSWVFPRCPKCDLLRLTRDSPNS